MYYYDDRQHPIYVAYRAYLDGDNSKVTGLPEDMQEMLNKWLRSANYNKSAYQLAQETKLPSTLLAQLKTIRKHHKRYKIDNKHVKFFAEDFLRVLNHEGVSISEISRRVNCSPSLTSSHMQSLEKKQKVAKEIKYTKAGKVTVWKAL